MALKVGRDEVCFININLMLVTLNQKVSFFNYRKLFLEFMRKLKKKCFQFSVCSLCVCSSHTGCTIHLPFSV